MDVEIFKTGSLTNSVREDIIVLKVGAETRAMPIGQWSALIAKPQKLAPYPGGIDDLKV